MKIDKRFFKGLIKEMKKFLEGKNPKNLRVFKIDKNSEQIEIINELELIKNDF